MKDKILSILITNKGKRHLKSINFEQQLNISGATFRKLINEIIEEQYPNGWIVQSDAKGYFIPSDEAELLKGQQWIEGRVWKILARYRKIKEMGERKFGKKELNLFEEQIKEVMK